MKIGRWMHGDRVAEGFFHEGRVIEFAGGGTVLGAVQAGLPELPARFDAATASGKWVEITQVRPLAPVYPPAIRDFVTFEEHVEGISAGVQGERNVPPEWYEAPTFYFTNPHTVLGDGDVVSPPVTEKLDFELEVAVVVGGPEDAATGLSSDEAASRIFGYTIMNDWSARDIQAREMLVHLGPAKGKDFGTTLGPWIVTADELTGYLDGEGFLAITAEVYVNGELVGVDLLSNMGWTFPELIAYASRNARVVPGDVLGSGTTGNGGCLGELWGRNGGLIPPPLQEGDEVRMVVEGLGEITNRVGSPVPAPTIPPARQRSRMRSR